MTKKQIDVTFHPDETFNYKLNADYFAYYVKEIQHEPNIVTDVFKVFPHWITVVYSIIRKIVNILAHIPIVGYIVDLIFQIIDLFMFFVYLFEPIILYIPAILIKLIFFSFAKMKYARLVALCSSIEQEIDRNLQDVKANIENDIIERYHINRENIIRSSLIISDYVPGKTIGFVKGSDGEYRTQYLQILVYIFTRDEIFTYFKTYNLINPTSNESAMTSFYQDVTFIGTRKLELIEWEKALLPKKKGFFARLIDKFKNITGQKQEEPEMEYTYTNLYMLTRGKNCVEINIRNNDNQIDYYIKALRSIIREKKNNTALLENIAEMVGEV